MIEFTKLELIEISATLGQYLAGGDTERHEKQYGTLTLLHEAQAKILPAAFGFTIDDTPWGSARAQQIAELRVEMGLPETPTTAEVRSISTRVAWRATRRLVTNRRDLVRVTVASLLKNVVYFGYTNVYPCDNLPLCQAKTLASVFVLKRNSARRSKGLVWLKTGGHRKCCASSCRHSPTGIKAACKQICSLHRQQESHVDQL